MDPVLKQRLIGAGVIWLLAMIFLPLILGGERESQSTRVELGLPAEVGAPREVREVRLDQPEAEAGPEIAQPVEQPPEAPPEAPEEKTAPSPPEPEPEPVPEAADEPPPESPPAPAEEASPEGWFVQVGSFGNPENARGLKERLEDHDYPAMISEYEAEGTTLHRVRVGGFESRELAEKAQENLYERMGLNGRVLEAD